MTLSDALNYAARWLPELWTINVYVERGFGELSLYDDQGEGVAVQQCSKEFPAEEVLVDMVRRANPNAEEPKA